MMWAALVAGVALGAPLDAQSCGAPPNEEGVHQYVGFASGAPEPATALQNALVEARHKALSSLCSVQTKWNGECDAWPC